MYTSTSISQREQGTENIRLPIWEDTKISTTQQQHTRLIRNTFEEQQGGQEYFRDAHTYSCSLESSCRRHEMQMTQEEKDLTSKMELTMKHSMPSSNSEALLSMYN